jgi:molybdopterin biosynthesis enzyme MoaB
MAGDRAAVEIADRHRDDDEQILAVLAHEFAHIVLDAPGSGVSPRDADDEELADAMVVMAGLGPLLLRSSYREGLSRSGSKVVGTIRRTGSLHPVAIAYLTQVQAEMAGLSPEARQALVGDWLEKKK